MSAYRPPVGAENRRLVHNPRDGYSDRPVTVPCGQCRNCRINARSHNALRAVLEADMHPPGTSWFVTLTEDDEHIDPSGSVSKVVAQKMVRRCRDHAADLGHHFRYVIVSEYGETFHRPHYHGLFYGLPLDDLVLHDTTPAGDKLYTSATLSALWGRGHILVGALTADSAGYCMSYAEKRVTGDPAAAHYTRVNPSTGEVWQVLPEFSLRSLKPGIGLPWFAQYKAECLSNGFIVRDDVKHPIPPYFLRHISEAEALALKADRVPSMKRAQAAEEAAHIAVNPDPLESMSRRFVRSQISERRHQNRVRDAGGAL